MTDTGAVIAQSVRCPDVVKSPSHQVTKSARTMRTLNGAVLNVENCPISFDSALYVHRAGDADRVDRSARGTPYADGHLPRYPHSRHQCHLELRRASTGRHVGPDCHVLRTYTRYDRQRRPAY